MDSINNPLQICLEQIKIWGIYISEVIETLEYWGKKRNMRICCSTALFKFLTRGRTHLQALATIGFDNTKFQHTRLTYNCRRKPLKRLHEATDTCFMPDAARDMGTLKYSCKVPLYSSLVSSPQYLVTCIQGCRSPHCRAGGGKAWRSLLVRYRISTDLAKGPTLSGPWFFSLLQGTPRLTLLRSLTDIPHPPDIWKSCCQRSKYSGQNHSPNDSLPCLLENRLQLRFRDLKVIVPVACLDDRQAGGCASSENRWCAKISFCSRG